jgi:ribonuclease G
VTVIANTIQDHPDLVDLSELRVAVLEEGRTVETYIERRGAGSIAGNIYKAQIDNILPAIDAAFVDFGAPRTASCRCATWSSRHERHQRAAARRSRLLSKPARTSWCRSRRTR